MAKYTTVENVWQTINVITSRTNITSAETAFFIDRAESIVDAKLACQYTLPFASTPPMVETIATDMAVGRLLKQRIFTQEKRNDSTWPKVFDEAMDLLDSICDGSIPLTTSSGDVIGVRTDRNVPWSSTTDYNPTFTEDAPRNQFIDPDKIEDIRDDRDESFYPI